MTAAIETIGLGKSYGRHVALRDLSLAIPEGSLAGFLGPNGAGKTTSLRILLGLLRPSSGAAWLFGRDCWADGPASRARVGYLPGELHLYETLTGRATLRFLADARRRDCAGEIARLARSDAVQKRIGRREVGHHACSSPLLISRDQLAHGVHKRKSRHDMHCGSRPR